MVLGSDLGPMTVEVLRSSQAKALEGWLVTEWIREMDADIRESGVSWSSGAWLIKICLLCDQLSKFAWD